MLRNWRYCFPLGSLFLVTSIFIGKVTGGQNHVADFFEGLFLGLAFTMNLFGLIRMVITRHYERESL
jgi:hypothetical protein